MKPNGIVLAAVVLVFGLGASSALLDRAAADSQGKREGKDKGKPEATAKDKTPIPQHLISSVEQLIRAKDALKASVQKEASEKHLQQSVLKQLKDALDEVEKGIKHAETA